MIYPHWMPLHRGSFGPYTDKDVFKTWNPKIIKIVWDGSKVPYLEDIPPNAKIIWRNYPLSEEFHGGLNTAGMMRFSGLELPDISIIGDNGLPQNGSARDGRYVPKIASRAALELPTPEQAASVYVRNAVEVAEYCESRGIPRTRLLFEGPNEYPVWSHGYDGLARLEAARLRGLHSNGLFGVVSNLGVGWPGNTGKDTPPVWAWALPFINEMRDGDYLGVHEYWSLAGITQNWRWWAGRILQCPYNVPVIVTEGGIDVGVEGVATAKKGWLDLSGTLEQKVARYLNELWQYCEAVHADGRVKAMTVYTYDGNRNDWGQFDIRLELFVEKLLARVQGSGLPVAGTIKPPTSDDDYLPEFEPSNDPATIAEKLRWWKEEEVRQREMWQTARADAIAYSSVKLLYRLEAMLKARNAER